MPYYYLLLWTNPQTMTIFEDIAHVQQFTILNSMALSRWYLQARMFYIGDTQIKCTTAA